MSISRKKLPVGQLSLGMYVTELDRPWLDTPFKIQGFLLKNVEQLQDLKECCQFVYIDVEQGVSSPSVETKNVPDGFGKTSSKKDVVAPAIYTFTRYQRNSLASQKTVKKDFYQLAPSLDKVQTGVTNALVEVHHCLERGEVFRQEPVVEAASQLVSCVLDNPDVMAWLGKVGTASLYLQEHAMRSALWACTFAKALGVDRAELEILVQAILLKDVGKTRLPKHLLQANESDLSRADSLTYQKFVSLSIALLKQVKGLNPKILPIIQSHREHYDGSGFPQGFKGDEIPFLAIVAAMSTHYDLLVHPSSVDEAVSPSVALKQMHRVKNKVFQEDVVEDFHQAMGVFPPASFVLLSDDSIAIVLEQDADSKLRPKVAVVTDSKRKPLRKPIHLDLRTQALPLGSSDTSKPHLAISQDLSASEIHLDLIKLQQQIFSPKKSLFSVFK